MYWGKNDNLEVTSATFNGETCPVDSAKIIYQGFLHCYIRGEYVPEKPLDTDMTLKVINVSGEEMLFTFSRVTAVKVHVTINGGGNYYINYANYETLVNTLKDVAAGKAVSQ